MRQILMLILCVCCSEMQAQKPAQFIHLGEEAEAAGKTEEAFSLYEQAYLMDSTNFEASLHYANGARLIKDYLLAERMYARVFTKDNGKLFSEGLFWLAMMQKNNGKYEEALRNFKKYAKKNKKKKDYTYLKSMREAESCAWAINYKSTSDSLKLKSPGDKINTPESENAPVLHENYLFFSAYRHAGKVAAWSLQQAAWKDSVASDVHELEVRFQKNAHLANITFSTDGFAYFTLCSGEAKCGIWRAKWNGKELSDPEDVKGINERAYTSTMPHISTINGFDYLFFASDRDGSFGKMDIWISRLQDGEWSEPVNAGDIINTPDDELTPFYSGGHLYFSSSWHNGFGGQDIFRIEGKPGAWSIPVNMGKPVNSNKNDFFFSVFPDQHSVFFASNREGSEAGDGYETCCNDIYMASLPTNEEVIQKGTYKDLAELNRFLPVRLYFHNDEPNPRSLDTTTTLMYSEAYHSYKKLEDVYIRENTVGLKESALEEAEFDVEDFFRLTVDKGMEDLVIFEDLLLKELKQGHHIRLSIRGFASPRAKSDYNENLTKRRIASLVNELKVVNHGVFKPYIDDTSVDGGKLEFEALPFGEYQADKTVSDDLNDEKQSIYSRGARMERKIEIESVNIVPQDKKAIMKWNEESHDFGVIPKFGVVHHSFYVTNEGNAPLVIDSVIAECGCTDPKLDKYIILPGEKVAMDVGFDPFGKKGRETMEITIYPLGKPPRVLTISADVQR